MDGHFKHEPRKWSPSPRQLLRLVTRQRRNFDRGGGELLHASDAATLMEQALRDNGYAWATVELNPIHDRSGKDLEEVRFIVDGGPRWKWGLRFFEGAPPDLEARLRSIFSGYIISGGVFNQRVLDSLRSDVVELLRLDGYTLAQAKVR